MKTDNEILTLFFQLLNVASVTSGITGGIYKGEKPLNSELEDIVINIIYNKTVNRNHLQTGVVNINIFSKETQLHTRPAVRLDELTNLVLTALNLLYNEGVTGQLSYYLDSQKVFRDNDNTQLFYSNIRLDFTYKN